jgi:Lon protease-like protein
MTTIQSGIHIPAILPVMTLGKTVLFPQAILPLHIFEPRYRTMLKDVLNHDRLFAIATHAPSKSPTLAMQDTPYPVACVGIVRACIADANGSSNLVLQGVARIQLEQVLCESPYRTALVQQIHSEDYNATEQISQLRAKLFSLIRIQRKLGAKIPKDIIGFLQSLSKPEDALDLAIHSFCQSTELRLKLLETHSIVARFQQFFDFMALEIERLKMDNNLRSDMDEEQIGLN